MKKICFLLLLSLLYLSACQINKPKSGFVIISPEIAEIFSQIADQKLILGVAEECNYPESLKSKPKVGNFGQINLESIIKLNPKYVLCSSLEQKAIAEELTKVGIEVVVFYPKKVTDIIDITRQIGILTNNKPKADSLANNLSDFLNHLSKSQILQKKNVFVEIYNEPIMSTSDSSFVGELISYAGAKNIFPVLERDYCRVKNEDVIKANPDVIIITYPGMTKEMIKQRKGWENINAVKNDKILTVEDLNPDLLLRATPRSIYAITKLREKIYE